MKKIIYIVIIFICIRSYAIVIHNPDGLAVWFESAVTGTGGSTTNYDSLTYAGIDSLIQVSIANGTAQLKNGDTIFVTDSITWVLLDSMLSILSNGIKTIDSLAIVELTAIKDSIATTNSILRKQLENDSCEIIQQIINAGTSITIPIGIKSFQIYYDMDGGASYSVQIGTGSVITFNNYNYPTILYNNNIILKDNIIINCITGKIILITIK